MFTLLQGWGFPSAPRRSSTLRSRVLLVCCAATACGTLARSPDSGLVGGFVAGATDTHCTLDDGGARVQPTSQAACSLTAPPSDAGLVADGAPLPPRFNGVGDDDDCKYHLTVTSDPLRVNEAITFNVRVTSKVDGGGVVGANVMPEVYMEDGHQAPATTPMSMESPGGFYGIMPMRFDRSGRWVVRFHIFGDCADASEDSPHGHGAFFVDLP